ncbi:hypothetical protein PG994_002536 [Apiospora phragmitis]|uniref:Uncharacterized protein n=1 Tax=Apiospora phragmitis TaxID=2905665 RepID=A0ABR1W5G3_9PEZI
MAELDPNVVVSIGGQPPTPNSMTQDPGPLSNPVIFGRKVAAHKADQNPLGPDDAEEDAVPPQRPGSERSSLDAVHAERKIRKELQ